MNLQTFISHYPTKTFEAKTTIITADQPLTHVFAITKGVAKMSHTHSSGDEVILSIITPLSIIPLPEAYLNRPNHYDYTSYTKLEASLIPVKEFIEYANKHPEVMKSLFEKFLKGFMVLTGQITALKHNHAADKINTALDQITGKDCATYDIDIVKTITQADIANFAGVSRETVSRHLAKK